MSDRHIDLKISGKQISTIPGYSEMMEYLRTTPPFVPSKGYAALAGPKGDVPPLYHMMSVTSSVLSSREAVIDVLPQRVLIRVGNAVTGPYVFIWAHREMFRGRYVDFILLRHSEDDINVIFHIDEVEMAVSWAGRMLNEHKGGMKDAPR